MIKLLLIKMNKIIFFSLLITCLTGPTLRTTGDLSCKVHNPSKKDCGYYGINQLQCEKIGCCWKEDSNPSIPWCFYGQDDTETLFTSDGLSCAVDKELREECGYYGIDKNECEENGCCWKVDDDDSVIPWCFHGINNFEDEGNQENHNEGVIMFDNDY